MDTIQERYLEMCLESSIVLLSSMQTICSSVRYLCDGSAGDIMFAKDKLYTTEVSLTSYQQNLCSRLADLQDFIQTKLEKTSECQDDTKIDQILDRLENIERILNTANTKR